MTKQEAIEWFELMKEKFENTKYEDALNMAIEALRQETVSRESYDHEFNLRKEFEMKVSELEKKIAEPKRGKWIVDRYCSECEWDKKEAGFTSGWKENYCPNCGAKMNNGGEQIMKSHIEMLNEIKSGYIANCNNCDDCYDCYDCGDCDDCNETVRMATEALKQIESGRYVKGECDRCSKKYGTLGCCTTVNNHWIYSCKEGMAQYAEALEQEPSCRNPRQVDLISRKDAIEATEKESQVDGAYGYMDTKTIVDLLNDLPSADRPTGKWVKDKKFNTRMKIYVCSNCKYRAWGDREKTPYCPNCGSRMESDEQ